MHVSNIRKELAHDYFLIIIIFFLREKKKTTKKGFRKRCLFNKT